MRKAAIILVVMLSHCLPDGRQWEEQRFGNARLKSILYNGLNYVVDGEYFDNGFYKILFFTSSDGRNWNTKTTNIEGRFVGYFNGEYVALDSNGNFVYTSSDLASWTSSLLPFETKHIVYNGSSYIAQDTNATRVSFSTNLINWSEPQNLSISNYDLRDISTSSFLSYLNEKYFMNIVLNDLFQTFIVVESNDCVNWEVLPEFHGLAIRQKKYISNEYIFVGNNGVLFKHENGQWVNHSVLFGPHFNGVARGRHGFVFTGFDDSGENPVIWSTENFFVWKAAQHDIKTRVALMFEEYDAGYSDILFTGEKYIVVGRECVETSCEGVILTAAE